MGRAGGARGPVRRRPAASEPGVGLELRALRVTARRRSPFAGRQRHSRCLFARPASRAGGRAGRLFPGHWLESRSRPGLGAPSVSPGRAGQDSETGRNCPLAGAAAAAAARSWVLPVIVKCFGNQHLERSIFFSKISNQSASFLTHHNPLTYPSYVSLQKEKKKVCIYNFLK